MGHQFVAVAESLTNTRTEAGAEPGWDWPGLPSPGDAPSSFLGTDLSDACAGAELLLPILASMEKIKFSELSVCALQEAVKINLKSQSQAIGKAGALILFPQANLQPKQNYTQPLPS